MLDALITRGAPDGPVLVLLHGRGSDERDLLPIGGLLHPDATTVSVRAPFDAAPWGYGPGYAWYRFLGGTTAEASSFDAGQRALAEFVDALPARLGRDEFPLVVGGFSQGGTTALAYALRHPGKTRGVMVFSGFLADDPSIAPTEARVRSTPIFWGHGTADLAVPFEIAAQGWKTLRDAGAPFEAHEYRGMSHTITEEELHDAAVWLARVLAQRAGRAGGT